MKNKITDKLFELAYYKHIVWGCIITGIVGAIIGAVLATVIH